MYFNKKLELLYHNFVILKKNSALLQEKVAMTEMLKHVQHDDEIIIPKFFWNVTLNLFQGLIGTYLIGLPRLFGRNQMLSILLFCISLSGFSQNAKRVISLAPSITENIYLIGAEDKLVGCTSYCTQALADGVEQVGSTIDVNIEKILTLQPDLVLTMLMTKSQDLEAIRQLGIKVEIIPTPINFNEVCEQTEQIARLFGEENSAKEKIQQIKTRVDSLKQVCNKIPSKQKIFFQIGSNPVFTVLPNTFMDDFILFCNGENIANEMTKGTITRESVLVKNPDVIIIATMGGFGDEEMKTWKSYQGLKAAENDRIFLVDSETACSPTPDNFEKAFTDIVQFLTR